MANKKIKVGILTLYPTHNYGGILQCIALYNFLLELGYEPIVIHRPKYDKKTVKYLVKKILERIPGQNIKNIRDLYLTKLKHKKFIDTFLPNKTKKYSNAEDLKQVVSEYGLDAIIVGSDQVWRYAYINDGHFENYFLDFVTNDKVKKIAFSASFGKNSWEDNESIPTVKKLINKFDFISVREKSGIDVCSKLFGFNQAKHTLDPTMLVDDKIYDKIIELSTKSSIFKNKLVTYILDENQEKNKIIKSIAEEKNLQIVNLHGFNNNKEFISVPDWCAAIKNAELIVTDSFHGMVFSILFKKEFFIIPNDNRGLARFNSLLEQFDLLDRIITNIEEANIAKKKEINYDEVKSLLVKYKIDAIKNIKSNCDD